MVPSDWVFDETELRNYELTLAPGTGRSCSRTRDEQYAEADLHIANSRGARQASVSGSVGTLAACFADDGRPLCSS